MILLVLLLLAVGTTTAAERETVLLRYRVSPGDSCSYDMDLIAGMAVRGMTSGASSALHSVFAVHVSDSTEHQVGINVDVLAMRASLQGAPGRNDTTMDMPIERDSRLRVIMDRKGNVLFAWPSAGLLKAYTTGGRLAGGGIQNSLRKIFLVYPVDSLHPGNTWQVTTADTISPGGNTVVTRMTNTLTYIGLADTLGTRCARISIASDTIAVEGKGAYNGSSLTVSGGGRMFGTYYVELVSGMPVAGVLQSDIDMVFTPSEPSASDNALLMRNTSDLVLRRSVHR